MTDTIVRHIFFAAVLLFSAHCRADPVSHAPWSTYAIAAAAFDETDLRVALLEARRRVTEKVSIGGALAFVDTNSGLHETQARLYVTGSTVLRGWTLDNRHLLTFGEETRERYRLRLRAISPYLMKDVRLSLRAYDEFHVDLVETRKIRNIVAAGFGLEVGRRGTLEVYQWWSNDRGGRDTNYLLAMFTLRMSQ